MTVPSAPPLAAVLIAHGDRGGPSPNASLAAQAAAVAALTGIPIATGLLKGEPSIEDGLARAVASGAGRIAVYPLFMADGYFVTKVRERVAAVTGLAHAPTILTPLGLDPAISDVLVEEALATARHTGFDPLASRLLIVGHGSKLGPASAIATRHVAARAAVTRRFASVATAFLEEVPFLDDALRASAVPTLVAGFFFGDGLHSGEDVPDAISETGATAVYTGAIGNSSAVANLIATALSRAISGHGSSGTL